MSQSITDEELAYLNTIHPEISRSDFDVNDADIGYMSTIVRSRLLGNTTVIGILRGLYDSGTPVIMYNTETREAFFNLVVHVLSSEDEDEDEYETDDEEEEEEEEGSEGEEGIDYPDEDMEDMEDDDEEDPDNEYNLHMEHLHGDLSDFPEGYSDAIVRLSMSNDYLLLFILALLETLNHVAEQIDLQTLS